jgi:HAD superfamily hydrolase (TIGR01493 family)
VGQSRLAGTHGVPANSFSYMTLENIFPKMLNSVVRNAGLEDRFLHVLSVDELRTYKPSPIVYRLAEDRLGIPRKQIGFVSSNGWVWPVPRLLVSMRTGSTETICQPKC